MLARQVIGLAPSECGGEDTNVSAETGPATTKGPDEHVRRVRLPADRRTPAAARAVVRSVLTEANLDELVNEALLLTTELSTNAVEHAGTELDIEVSADSAGLTVTVSDFAAGPVDELTVGVRNVASDIVDVAERGRGLLLVDHFASRWGTTYLPNGKGVWFRLDRRRRGGQHGDDSGSHGDDFAPPVGDRDSTGHTSAASAGAMSALLQITPDPYAEDPLPDFAAGLLTRVAEMVGAAGGVDPAGPRGRPGHADARPLRPAAPRGERPDPGAAGRAPPVRRRAGAGRRAHRVRPAARGADRRAALAAPGERPAAPCQRPPAGLADLPRRGQ